MRSTSKKPPVQVFLSEDGIPYVAGMYDSFAVTAVHIQTNGCSIGLPGQPGCCSPILFLWGLPLQNICADVPNNSNA